MTSSNVTKTLRKKPLSKFYVYYNGWNGEIISVASQADESIDQSYIVTESQNAEKIISGEVDARMFLVSYDNNLDELVLIEKDDTLRLRSSEKFLYQIPRKDADTWDFRLQLYTENAMLNVEVNPNSIAKLTNLTFRKQLVISDDSDLDIYVTRHNDPDHFIDKIEVDPAELLTNGNIIYDLSDIKKHISFDNIGFMTRRCFQRYQVEIYNSKLMQAQKSLAKQRKNAIIKSEYNNVGHIEIQHKGNDVYYAVSKIGVNEYHNLGLHSEWLVAYAVGKTPDEFYGTVPINIFDLRANGKVLLNTDLELGKLNLIHNKPKLLLTTKDFKK